MQHLDFLNFKMYNGVQQKKKIKVLPTFYLNKIDWSSIEI